MTKTVTLGERTVVLVGTAHISERSVRDVREAIATEQPDCVCVELDDARYATISQQQHWMELDIRRVLKQRKGFLMLTNIVLHSFQRRLGLDLGVQPGAEMAAAVAAAQAGEIRFELCDRDIQVTLRRAWRRSRLWGRLKLLAALLAGAFSNEELDPAQVEALKEKGALQNMLEELAGYLPQVKEVLIDERDRYLAARIFAAGGTRTVAVVGAGHVPGVERRLSEYARKPPRDNELEELDHVPPRGLAVRLLPWTIPALFVALVGYGFLRAGAEMTIEKLGQWVLVNGSFAALGALVALAHPVTILSSFAAAPITSVNPTIGVGLVAGLVQAVVRKPRVVDFEHLSQDVTSLRGILRNRVTHVLAVFFLSSVGSAIGTFVGLSFLTSLLRGGG
jgi:pheromone shutdown-related protein TraB